MNGKHLTILEMVCKLAVPTVNGYSNCTWCIVFFCLGGGEWFVGVL